MKQVAVLLGILVAALSAKAQETPHYPNGTSGLKAGTIPPVGWYHLIYSYNYHADEMIGDDGLPQNFRLDINAYVHRLLRVTDYKILGADYSWNVVLPVAHVGVEVPGAGVTDHFAHVADLNAEPFVIEWRKERYDFGYVYGFFAPTAPRSDTHPAQPGKHYWTHYAGIAGTYYFDEEKTWTASILSRYEVNGRRRYVDFTAGDNFSFEWGIGKSIQSLSIGTSGYCSWQATPNRGTGVVNDQLDRSFAIGPEIQYFSPDHKIGFYFRYWREFEVFGRPKGRISTITFVIPF